MSAAPNVQILNNPFYKELAQWDVELTTMLTQLRDHYANSAVDGNLIKGIETHMRITSVSVHNAMKQMRGEPL